jgi:Flp pilus assembly protein TadG
MEQTRCRSDDGTITVLFAVVFVAFLMMLGLVVDGGRLLDQRSHAHDVAAKAARAGAQQLGVGGFVGAGGLDLDPTRAQAAAHDYLAKEGMAGVVTVAGPTVTVTVTDTVQLTWLRLVGATSKQVSATASADARTG